MCANYILTDCQKRWQLLIIWQMPDYQCPPAHPSDRDTLKECSPHSWQLRLEQGQAGEGNRRSEMLNLLRQYVSRPTASDGVHMRVAFIFQRCANCCARTANVPVPLTAANFKVRIDAITVMATLCGFLQIDYLLPKSWAQESLP